jgi:hypothetical protein
MRVIQSRLIVGWRGAAEILELQKVPRPHSPTSGARQMPFVMVAQNTNTDFFAQ